MVDELRRARDESVNPIYLEFLQEFIEDANVCYGFVEGKDDPCFYRGIIDNNLPLNWSVNLRKTGNKDKVIKLYSLFEWTRFDKMRILFFIDRDLSEVMGENTSYESNIYITDEYSIENSITNKYTCERILYEIYGFQDLKKEEKDEILNLFEEQLASFQDYMIPIMSNIIYWKNTRDKANYQNIKLKDIFKMESGVLTIKLDKPDLIRLIHKQSGADFTKHNNTILQNIEASFYQNNYQKKYIRGKFIFWFFVEFCESIYNNSERLPFGTVTKPSKKGINMSESNAILQAAPRSRMPVSLKAFIDNTIMIYIKNKMIT